jgi:hypothetical protein
MLVGVATLVGKESNTDTDVNGWSFDCGGAEIKDVSLIQFGDDGDPLGCKKYCWGNTN